jgi:GT2 family glycosyltransferase
LTPKPPAEQPRQPPKVSVVVVSHNRAERLRRCVESLERSEDRATFEVIVVDNGSADESPQLESEFSKVRFFRLPKNFGLTKALNIGLRAAEAEYILLLHEDTEVSAGAIRELAAALDADSGAAAVCPLLVDPEDRAAPQLGVLPPDGEWQPAEPSGNERFAVLYPRGAALMIRAFVIRSLRQIDERYGQFGSDADLAAQIRRASKKILLVPAARVKHYGRDEDWALRNADFLLGRAVYRGKYEGFFAGILARVTTALQLLVSFRLSELRYVLAGQKIDGSQE